MPPTIPPTPLTAAELAECSRMGARLQTDLQNTILALPPVASTNRGLADHLQIDRGICQRIGSAIRITDDLERVLSELPGLGGLTKFVEGLRRVQNDKLPIQPLERSLAQLDQLILELAGSRGKFLARLRASEQVDFNSSARDLKLRKRRFALDADILGISIDTRVVLDAFRPIPDQESHIEYGHINGCAGVRAQQGGMPFLMAHMFDSCMKDGPEIRSITGTPITNDPQSLILKSFSTTPLPALTSQGSDFKAIYAVDQEGKCDSPFDLFVGRSMSPASPHPREHDDHLLRSFISPRYPFRRLIYDAYMHESMAKISIPSTAACMRSMTPIANGPQPWFDRLPFTPTIEVLESGAARPNAPDYARHGELTSTLFSGLGWNASEFVCYRLSIEYPLVGMDYSVSFDFAP